MNELLDIAAKEAIHIIQIDRLRSSEAKEQDIKFLIDQRNERLMKISPSKDTVYRKTAERKLKRVSDCMLRKEQCSIVSTQNNNSNEVEDDEPTENVEEVIDNDANFVEK